MPAESVRLGSSLVHNIQTNHECTMQFSQLSLGQTPSFSFLKRNHDSQSCNGANGYQSTQHELSSFKLRSASCSESGYCCPGPARQLELTLFNVCIMTCQDQNAPFPQFKVKLDKPNAAGCGGGGGGGVVDYWMFNISAR